MVENLNYLKSIDFWKHAHYKQIPLSCMEPLFPLPDTQFEMMLKHTNKYCYNTTIKYKFEFKDTEWLFFIICKWREIISEKLNEIGRNYLKHEYPVSIISQANKLLLKFDLEILLHFCEMVSNNKICITSIATILDECRIKLEMLLVKKVRFLLD